ncbi:hypothetical protein [Eubacterium aggregans]|uniref:hypothetical protein n=1 Tax=Eubacterium aggregans TaxID=81409 RepID=UPI003F350B1D
MTTKKGDAIQDILALEGTQVALDQLKKDLMAIDDELLAQSKQYSSVLGNMITSNSNRLSEWEAIRINELDKYKHVLDDYTLRVDQKLTEVNEAAIRTMERANRILSGELWKHYLIYLGAGMSALNFRLLISVLFLR